MVSCSSVVAVMRRLRFGAAIKAIGGAGLREEKNIFFLACGSEKSCVMIVNRSAGVAQW